MAGTMVIELEQDAPACSGATPDQPTESLRRIGEAQSDRRPHLWHPDAPPPPDSEHYETHEAPGPQALVRALRLVFLPHCGPETVQPLPKPCRAYQAAGYGGHCATLY
ncbi:hypothetical protein HPB48_022089 [Haemaphysalis longicornis]|uniref:Uncharacterized protein n=1 Tax=Haemaphysalis longicornis TaxID=44386 RepID=A0A9J6FX08_HAELO|nr:hypothetical protein HPB48_022089 [Haemaphysalis longicornis]